MGKQPVKHVQNNLDCNDNNINVNPGKLEICDNIDNNCDNAIDNVTTITGTGAQNDYPDGDGDTFGRSGSNAVILCPINNNPPPNYSINRDDCDDMDNQRAPGRLEICDNKDNNCDNQIDNVTTIAGTGATNFYIDSDGDGHGRSNASAVPRCATAQFPPAGYSSLRDDCNDNNVNINPKEAEICNRIDDNCSNRTDEGCPASISISAGSLVSIDTNGDQVPDTNFFGAGAGTPQDFRCNAGEAVTRLNISFSAGRVIQLLMWCSSASVVETPSSGTGPYLATVDSDIAVAFRGTIGRDYTETHARKDLYCDGDSFLRRVRIKYGKVGVGSWDSIRALKADCDDITLRLPPPNAATIETSATPSSIERWGDFNANLTNYQVSCPAGQAVTGLR